VEFEGFMVWYLNMLSTEEEVITLFSFSQSEVLTLFGAILEYLEDFAGKCISSISFREESAQYWYIWSIIWWHWFGWW
jgi:hypothetical protein